ncbi:MAG: hypothetical protein J2O49_11290, partial [Sciscionella sp.]|nr:hypothetical protein [Sciscionella sp.]
YHHDDEELKMHAAPPGQPGMIGVNVTSEGKQLMNSPSRMPGTPDDVPPVEHIDDLQRPLTIRTCRRRFVALFRRRFGWSKINVVGVSVPCAAMRR